MIRFLTAGESHGKCLTLVVEGVPAGLNLSAKNIDRDLKRRQMGYGRGGRMKIESDRAEVTAGIRSGVTLGSPIAVTIQNKDWENWQEVMSPEKGKNTDDEERKITRPRPGHADLAGGIKYHHRDLRNILERASARETAARVAAGGIAKRFLNEFHIYITSFVTQIGGTGISGPYYVPASFGPSHVGKGEFEQFQEQLDNSPLRCPDPEAEKLMIEAIDAAKEEGNSLGGVFQVVAINVPPGLGSHVQWDRRLDARIAFAVMSIPAIKGVEIGLGFEAARRKGSQVHDEIYYEVPQAFEKSLSKNSGTGGSSQAFRKSLSKNSGMGGSSGGFYRKTNNAGGTEGGISNGEAVVVRGAMKPIPTLSQPLDSVDFISKEKFQASKERADVCAVSAAGVVGEAVVAIEIANAFLEKFGSDSVSEIKRSFEAYIDYISRL